MKGTDSSPAVSPDGRSVAIGSWDHHLYSVDARNGTRRWRVKTGGPIESCATFTRDNKVIIPSYDHNVWCVDGDTGRVQWTFDAGAWMAGAPLLDDDAPGGGGGVVYVGATDGFLRALRVSNGSLVWKYDTGGEVWSSPALVGRDAVCVGSGGSILPGLDCRAKVHCVRARDGAPLFAPVETGAQIQGAPVPGSGATPGLLYVPVYDGCVHALRWPNGTRAWTSCPSPGHRLESTPALLHNVSTAPGAAGGRVVREALVVGSADGSVYALDGATGAVLWAQKLAADGAMVLSSPAVDSVGVVYVGAGSAIFALDGNAGGAVQWRYPAGAPVYSSPALRAGGLLFVGSEDGYLRCLRGGAPSW